MSKVVCLIVSIGVVSVGVLMLAAALAHWLIPPDCPKEYEESLVCQNLTWLGVPGLVVLIAGFGGLGGCLLVHR